MLLFVFVLVSQLTDFGTASWISVGGGGGERRPTPGMREEKSSTNNERTHSFVGTAEYVSPEVRPTVSWAAG
jgi:serine/threonine protein kinase